MDVCYDDGGTAAFGDDFFWVVNVGDGTAIKYGYSFDPVYLTFDYSQVTSISGLDGPISIARGREGGNSCEDCDEYAHNDWLYILEASGVVKCFTNNQVPPGNDPNIAFQFSYQPSNDILLTSIAVDHDGILWCTDGYNSQLLTYYNNETELVETDRTGEYGVQNTNGQFALPTDISFIEAVHENLFDPEILEVHVDPMMFIQEMWTETTGGVRGMRGVGIRDLTADWVYPRDYQNRPVKINYFTTAFASNTTRIINSSGQEIRNINRSDIPGPVELIWDGLRYDGNPAPIDLYTIQLRDQEITFNTNSPPEIDYCNFDPIGCFDEEDYSRQILALASDPDGETWFKYHWVVEMGDIHRYGYPRQPGCRELIYEDDGESRIVFYPPPILLSIDPDWIQISLNVSDQTTNPAISYSDGFTFQAKPCE